MSKKSRVPTESNVGFGARNDVFAGGDFLGRSVSLDGLRELFTMVKTPGHAVWDGMKEVEPGTVMDFNVVEVVVSTTLTAPPELEVFAQKEIV